MFDKLFLYIYKIIKIRVLKIFPMKKAGMAETSGKFVL